MWTDIFIENKHFLIDTLNLFLKDINELKKFIKTSDDLSIFKLLKRTKEIRKSILKKEI